MEIYGYFDFFFVIYQLTRGLLRQIWFCMHHMIQNLMEHVSLLSIFCFNNVGRSSHQFDKKVVLYNSVTLSNSEKKKKKTLLHPFVFNKANLTISSKSIPIEYIHIS